MDAILGVEWQEMFSIDVPLLEIFLRGTIIYLSLFVILRLFHTRQVGNIGLSDVLVIVLVADASQNGMAGDHQSIPAAITLVLTIVFWNLLIDWMTFKFDWFEKFTCPAPLALIKNGKMLKKNMREEMITTCELMSQLRQQGAEHVSDVKKACLEPDGKISVVKFEK